ncbi:MAG TPA: aminodeoxychorismate synthase component I [Planctomycetales bacterium]|jgi:para-aminobenzoate synthetase component 1|nr:aminodeoxychorismate synthase component I [Planctomycetales bacterium]
MNHLSPEIEPIRPLVEELTPAPDPWQVCLRLSSLPHLLFLDSAGDHPDVGRYSFVTAQPFSWMTTRRGRINDGESGRWWSDPFPALASWLKRYRMERIPDLPPFQGGAAGLFGYDLCHHIERLPRARRDQFKTPDIAIGLYDWVVAFDHAQGRGWIISTGLPECDPANRNRRAAMRLDAVKRLLAANGAEIPPYRVRTAFEVAPGRLSPLPGLPGVSSNFDRPGYLKAVRRAVEYIHAGDCFQVNLSQRLLHRADRHPLELYRRLRERNSAPFAGYFDLGDFVIASASPERFLRVENGEIETRPIKGTRPRSATPEEDRRQIYDLMHSAKDRSENVMIVDLLRNDLGRVAAYGSIRVPAVCRLETYEHIHHLVSEVRGRLRPGLGPVDLLRAAFPGGSVTGAPKVRAMEIIAELEPTARGPYCGSLGYIGFDGSMDTNILIRTFTIGRGWMQFPVGGGVVADSDPEDEYAETLHKAEGLLRALRP